jgi:hypothetical protein
MGTPKISATNKQMIYEGSLETLQRRVERSLMRSIDQPISERMYEDARTKPLELAKKLYGKSLAYLTPDMAEDVYGVPIFVLAGGTYTVEPRLQEIQIWILLDPKEYPTDLDDMIQFLWYDTSTGTFDGPYELFSEYSFRLQKNIFVTGDSPPVLVFTE